MQILVCWRCEQPGHGWTDCRRPPAPNQQELDKRLNRLVIRWDAGYGELSTSMKTKLADIEIRQFKNARKAA
jgi:hypothetical protein